MLGASWAHAVAQSQQIRPPSSCTSWFTGDIAVTRPVTLLTCDSDTSRIGLTISRKKRNLPRLEPAEQRAQLVQINSALCVHAQLHEVHVRFSPGQNVAVVLERTDEDDRPRRVVADRTHLPARGRAHVRRPGARVAVRVRSLVQAQIAGIIEGERAAGELAVQQLQIGRDREGVPACTCRTRAASAQCPKCGRKCSPLPCSRSLQTESRRCPCSGTSPQRPQIGSTVSRMMPRASSRKQLV